MKNGTAPLLFSVALGSFMSALDASVVNISYPQIMNYFGIPQETVEWVITAYLLVICSVLLFFGRLSDLYGQKRLFIAGFAVFTAGSALCGLSVSVWMLVACRVIQALGAALLMATNSAIITHNVPAERRGRAFSVNAVAVATALAAGPVLGGVLTEYLKWQSIFYVNIPVGIAAIALSVRFIPADKRRPSLRPDIPGSAMIFCALFLILLPLNRLAGGIDIRLFFGLLVCGLALAAAFVIYEKKAKAPLVDMGLFRNRVFSAGLGASALNFTAQNMALFLLPLYLQTLHGNAPAEAGTYIVPMPLTMLVVAPFAGYLSDRIDTRFVSSAGMAVMAGGLFMLSFIAADTSEWYIRAAMVITGLGSGMFQTPNNSAVMNHVDAQYRGIASGMLSTARNTGMVIGVGLSGALSLLFSGMASRVYSLRGLAGAALHDASFIFGLRVTFIIASVVALGSMTASLTKGKVLTGKMLKADGGGNG